VASAEGLTLTLGAAGWRTAVRCRVRRGYFGRDAGNDGVRGGRGAYRRRATGGDGRRRR